MHIFPKLCGVSIVCASVLSVLNPAIGADLRGRAALTARGNGASVARMPTMPTLPGNTTGNMSPNLPDNNGGGTPSVPDDPGHDDPTPDDPTPECPDGGVKNSEFGIEECMNSVLSCVNGGALTGGINALFNEDLRNSIVNGMGLCSTQVDRCVSEVRRDCRNVYNASADVWLDFNSRRVQPEYYNFVLRKTGLTPNQAENTCLLLDRNTYGPSFAAVSTGDGVTAEYNNQVGAYNGQNGNILIKNNPRGATVNANPLSVDGQRGHYARWDATNAECWLRIGAYNKDTQIKNSWLFGAAGDDQVAEVWKLAGDTFTCNKDLFGFGLMNKTATAAVVGIGGGTVVGAGVGAIAGHGKRNFDCTINSQLKKLQEQLTASGKTAILNEYLDASNRISSTADLTVAQCNAIVDLYEKYSRYDTELDACDGTISETSILRYTIAAPSDNPDEYFQQHFPPCVGASSNQECKSRLDELCAGQDVPTCSATLSAYGVDMSLVQSTTVSGDCSFKPINLSYADPSYSIKCSGTSGECVSAADIEKQLSRLKPVLDNLTILQGEKSNMAKSIGIGAAVGAGTGGLATAITAVIEHSNINCRVGDGLNQVSFGKSHSIDSLKDFYVKWNLNLPDTIMPTPHAVDCASWRARCATLTDLNQCRAAQINYKPEGAATTTLVRSACMPSGSECIENYSVAKSYGACE